ncbi:MAG: segregation/condensation protein A [Candidatus Marinimicrobia bacterium]|nr:segregation/condensation protein A [Candidatus Neomarinimicrobiota bacterium]
MSYKINTNDFEGPLDLLLFFIQRDKLNVYDIPISEITHEFLDYISALNKINIEVGAEFIYMASLLMKIKSKMLLPIDDSDEEIIDPRHDLVLQLIEYKKFKNISNHLSKVHDKYNKTYRTKVMEEYSDSFIANNEILIGEFNLYDIIKNYSYLIENLPDSKKYQIEHENFSISEQIKVIQNKFRNKDKITFSSIIKQANSKAYLVCTFIAILEMIKSNEIVIKQKNSFSEIYIINNIN